MSSDDTWHNLLSGISQGSFDKIYLKDGNGAVSDILALLAGAGGTVASATLPLSIHSGVLNLELSGFCTSGSIPIMVDKWSDDHRWSGRLALFLENRKTVFFFGEQEDLCFLILFKKRKSNGNIHFLSS